MSQPQTSSPVPVEQTVPAPEVAAPVCRYQILSETAAPPSGTCAAPAPEGPVLFGSWNTEIAADDGLASNHAPATSSPTTHMRRIASPSLVAESDHASLGGSTI